MYKKLFIPGPTHVREEILQAQAAPMIGHRSQEYADLQGAVTPKLQRLLYTAQRVYLFASSSTGVMEGAVRQASHKKILNTVCGAFSKRWHQITERNGLACEKLEVPMGQAITPDLVDEALSNGGYDAITMVMNETSTGIMNPVTDIAALIHEKYPDVLILVDAVSAMAGAKIEFDAWGLDVCLAGKLSRLGMLLVLPRFMRGTHVTHPQVRMDRAQQITVESPASLPIHLDGEIFATDARQIEVGVVVGALRLKL